MADKNFGVKRLTFVEDSGTPTFTSPNNINFNAINVGIGTDLSIGGQLQSDLKLGSAYSIGIGTTVPTSKLHVVSGESRFSGVVENVSAATTYVVGNDLVLELDVRRSTVYKYSMPPAGNIGIVSFKNMPSDSENGTTITVLFTQNSSTPSGGIGNTLATTGIGTNCRIVPYVGGATVTGISTRALVSSGSTVVLSGTASDVDFVSFFIHYNGNSVTQSSNYKVYVTKNGSFRRGVVGI